MSSLRCTVRVRAGLVLLAALQEPVTDNPPEARDRAAARAWIADLERRWTEGQAARAPSPSQVSRLRAARRRRKARAET